MQRRRHLIFVFLFVLLFSSFGSAFFPFSRFSPVSVVKATLIFEDGFEGTDPDWSTTIGEGNTLDLNSTEWAFEGSESAKFIFVTGGIENKTYATSTSGTPDNYATIFMRFYVKITQATLPAANRYVRLGGFTDSELRFLGCLEIYDADYNLKVRYRNGTDYVTADTGSDLSLNTVYYIQIKRVEGGIGTGEYRVWLNGTEIWSDTNVDTDNFAHDRILIGGSGYYQADSNATYYIDNVAYDDEYIKDHYYFNFDFTDLDNAFVDSRITWELYNESEMVEYTEGEETLPSGTYTLKTYFHGVLMNTTSLSTETYGDQTVTIYLQMKLHESATVSPYNYSYCVTADNGTAIGIQAANDQVAAAGGGTVYIPEGTWNFSTEAQGWMTVNVSLGVSIHGAPTERDENGQVVEWKTILVMPWEVPTEDADDNPYWFELNIGSSSTQDGFRFSDIKLVGWRYFDYLENGEPSWEGEDQGSKTMYRGIYIYEAPYYPTGQTAGITNIRIDHCNFQDMGGSGLWLGPGESQYNKRVISGVVDHNRFVNSYGNPGRLPIPYANRTLGYGIGLRRWASDFWEDDFRDVIMGYHNYTVFIEDNYFSKWRHSICVNDGLHIVVRRNVFNDTYGVGEVDAHGSYAQPTREYAVGARTMEIYDNVFNNSVEIWDDKSWPINVRGGCAQITNNTLAGGFDSLVWFNQESGNILYQPKCKIHNTYIWSNDLGGGQVVGYDYNVTENVDYFLREPNLAQDGFTYSPYPYPHYLTQERGYLSFNVSVSDLTIHSQTMTNLTFSGSASNVSLVADVPKNATLITRNGEEWTDWIYNSTYKYILIEAEELSTWTFLFEYGPPEYQPPEYEGGSVSTTVHGESATFIAEWFAEAGLSHGILSHNASDTWVNRTAIPLDGVSDLFFDSFNLPDEIGKVVGYRFYANDTLGQWGDSGILNLTTTALPPECTNPSVNTTVNGETASFSAQWSADAGLSYGILSHNASDSWTNRTAIALSGTSDLFTDSFTLPTEVGKIVGYKFYANDTLGQWGNTTILTLTVTPHTATIGPFSLTSTSPITGGSWNSIEKILSFTSSGNITVAVGSYGSPSRINVDGQLWTDWTYASQMVTLTNVASQLEILWLTGQVGGPSNYWWSPFDLAQQYIAAGDLVGFLTAIFTSLMGEAFFAAIILIITVPLYMRTQSLTYVSLVWLLLGSVFAALLPPAARNVAYVFVILGIGGLLYKLSRREK